MLINLRNALMAGKRLPYDAEVEYLQSSGTQWIDTATGGCTKIEFCWKTPTPNVDLKVYGNPTNGNKYLTVALLSRVYRGTSIPTGTDWDIVKLDTSIPSMTVERNGVVIGTASSWWTGGSGTTGPDIYPIFGRVLYTTGAMDVTGTKSVSYFKAWDANGVLVRDFIPVRVGTVGYLYDRVSGALFGNAGTGDFVLGPDVVPVEWLESHGTEWIDTGVVPAANDTYTVETRKNNTSQDCASFGLAGCVYCFSNGRGLTDYGTFWGHIALGQGGIAGVNPLGDTNWHTIVASPTSVSVDGLPLGNRAGDAQSPLSTVKLFARGNNSASGGAAKQYNGMISHAFVGRGGSDLRKFYSVRVGQEGAMMDVLTRRIYRNAGTGAFGYGNDLKYPIPAS